MKKSVLGIMIAVASLTGAQSFAARSLGNQTEDSVRSFPGQSGNTDKSVGGLGWGDLSMEEIESLNISDDVEVIVIDREAYIELLKEKSRSSTYGGSTN